jgi:hypothetical protein
VLDGLDGRVVVSDPDHDLPAFIEPVLHEVANLCSAFFVTRAVDGLLAARLDDRARIAKSAFVFNPQ